MTELSDLRAQYEELSFDQLLDIKKNAVLSEEAMQVLQQVLEQKHAEHIESTGAQEKLNQAKENRDYSALTPSEVDYLTRQLIVTTETSPTGLEIDRRLDVITAECVYGMNLFRDFFASVRDVLGGRNRASQNVLRDARKVCIAELKREGLMLGADAIIGVRLDYSEVSGGIASQMLMIVASGTAVTLKSATSNLSNM